MSKGTFEKRGQKGLEATVEKNVSKAARPVLKGRLVSDAVKNKAKANAHTGKAGAPVGRVGNERSALLEPQTVYRSPSVILTPITVKPENQMTSIEKMEVTREGISKKALEEFKAKAGFDYDQLANVLGVARTTLINKKGREKFPLMLSEKIMSLADLYSFGYEIFGNQAEFNQWVFEPVSALGGQAPYDLLSSQYGREEVKNLIGRIAYGTYS
jgi:putative toxin-antitoxin system antitoxin component (TIGR02293 family)